MVFNAIFNNISAISWRSVLLAEETEVHGVHLAWVGFELTTLVVIGIYCLGSCKSNYHTITTTIIPPPSCWSVVYRWRTMVLGIKIWFKVSYCFTIMSYDGILLLSNIKIILNRTNITFVLKIKYIMYNVQDYIVLYNNTLCRLKAQQSLCCMLF
jgi:hypothetical protein